MACLCWTTIWHESQAKDAPKTPQDVPKIATRRVKMAPRHPKTHARDPQDPPKRFLDASKMRSRRSLHTPREPQDDPSNPKTPAKRSKTIPRRLQTSILVPRDLDFRGFWHRQTTPWTSWHWSNFMATSNKNRLKNLLGNYHLQMARRNARSDWIFNLYTYL